MPGIRSLASLLVLGMLAVAAMPAAAQYDRNDRNPFGAPAPPEVSFRYAPSWTVVPGTSVYRIQSAERPAFDLFRYAGSFYLYSNGYWYSAPSLDGRFMSIRPDRIPAEMSDVPSRYWVSYPRDWANDGNDGNDGNNGDWSNGNSNSAPPQVDLRYPPNWLSIPGTNVYGIRAGEGPGFDMFRFNGNYYIYENGDWYRSTTWNSRYSPLDDRNVPMELRRVPRRYWVSYPADWKRGRSGGWDTGNSAPQLPQFTLTRTPHWRPVGGTQVFLLRRSERPNFDFFRFGSQYYAYHDGYWYQSARISGPYGAIGENRVPQQFYDVPRGQWRSYPPEWASNGSYDRNR